MKENTFYYELCLGYECCGCGVYVDVEGAVMLEDEQVEQLVALIKEKDGETDVEKLQLEERYPDIYEALEDACREAAEQACYAHWVSECCGNDGEEEPEEDMDLVVDYEVVIPQDIITLAQE
ncbi:MAG: hypothetical protein IKX20_12275 [Paludibacteraceae bacterium]|nr:hypothetical protein [Paludibacteraceae bacterium]